MILKFVKVAGLNRGRGGIGMGSREWESAD